jgi:hypothetical protein
VCVCVCVCGQAADSAGERNSSSSSTSAPQKLAAPRESWQPPMLTFRADCSALKSKLPPGGMPGIMVAKRRSGAADGDESRRFARPGLRGWLEGGQLLCM